MYRNLLHEELDIGLATVYRVLTQFEQAGLLSRSNFESGKAVFELNEGSHHDHLVCLDCGLVEEFFDSEIENRQQSIAKERGFKLQEHALALLRCLHEGKLPASQALTAWYRPCRGARSEVKRCQQKNGPAGVNRPGDFLVRRISLPANAAASGVYFDTRQA